MSFYFTHESGLVNAFYDSTYNKFIPRNAVLLTDGQYTSAIEASEQGLELATDGTTITPRAIQPSQAEQEARERSWVQNQLKRTDFIILPDSPYTDDEIQKVKTYRAALRNPTRTTTDAFPDVSWRPVWPQGVKLPD